MSGMFEYMVAHEAEDRGVSRKAVALARVRADKRFAKFLNAAVSPEDKQARLTLVAGDLAQTVKQACAEAGHENWEAVLSTVSEHIGMTVEARRPKMCPVHREVVDISLGSGDPQAGFNAMASQLLGEQSCRGGSFEGKCNFKPEMVSQSFWDKRDEEAAERRDQRLHQEAIPDTKPHVEDFPVDPIDETDLDGIYTDDSYSDGSDYNDEDFGSNLDVTAEPAMAMAARFHTAGTIVENPLIHGGSMAPLREIAKRKPGLMINETPFDQFDHRWQRGFDPQGWPSVEVSHEQPQWEHLASQILQAGHSGPLKAYFEQKRQQRQAPPVQQVQPEMIQPAASIHEAEALKTIDVGQSEGPSPKIDKKRWNNDLKPIDTEMDGTPHPTIQQDIAEPADYTGVGYTDDSAVLEHQDPSKRQNPTDGGGPHTKTFPDGNQVNPVTSTIDPTGEDPDNFALCQNCGGKHAEGMCPKLSFISTDEINRAIASYRTLAKKEESDD